MISSWQRQAWRRDTLLTTRIVTGSQQDTTRGFAHTDQVAGRGGTQNTILAHQQLLDTVGGADLGNLGNYLGVVVATITTNDEESVLGTFGNRKKNTGDEGLGVMGLLKDLDLLAETRTGAMSTLGSREGGGAQLVHTCPASGP